MLDKETVCAAINRAVAAMEADPSKITSEFLARNKDDKLVFTTDPTACKFCALGFVARELNICTKDMGDLIDPLQLVGLHINAVWIANDDGVANDDPLAGARELARARETCKGEE